MVRFFSINHMRIQFSNYSFPQLFAPCTYFWTDFKFFFACVVIFGRKESLGISRNTTTEIYRHAGYLRTSRNVAERQTRNKTLPYRTSLPRLLRGKFFDRTRARATVTLSSFLPMEITINSFLLAKRARNYTHTEKFISNEINNKMLTAVSILNNDR